MGTPWGGFFWANFLKITPGNETIEKTFKIPMAREIASYSNFMQNLSRELPKNTKMFLYMSKDDSTASADTPTTKENFAKIVAQATTYHEVSGLNHDGYVKIFEEYQRISIQTNRTISSVLEQIEKLRNQEPEKNTSPVLKK